MTNNIRVIEKAARVLQLFTPDAPEWGVTDVSRRLELPKTVVYSIMESLTSGGVLTKDQRARSYRVGILAYQLGRVFDRQAGFYESAHEILRSLRDSTKQSVLMGIIDRGEMLNLVALDGTTDVIVISSEGERRPVYASAGGRAILSALPWRATEAILPDRLVKVTPHTGTDREHLKHSLVTAGQQGYAIAREELVESVSAIAIPVLDPISNLPVASVSVSFLCTSEARLVPEVINSMNDTTKRLSQVVGEALRNMGDNPKIVKILEEVGPDAQ